MIGQANEEIETLDQKHKALVKAHGKVEEELGEQKVRHDKALDKATQEKMNLSQEVKELKVAGDMLETRIRQLQQKVRFAELGVTASDAGKENSLVLSNSMGNNVMMAAGKLPNTNHVDMGSSTFGMAAQPFRFNTPTNTAGVRSGYTNDSQCTMQQMAAMMAQSQQKQLLRQQAVKSNSGGNNMAIFQQYLKFQQMQQQFSGFQ